MSRAWTRAQQALLVAGALLVGALVLAPQAGLAVLWNGVIPLAPAVLVVAPGLFRNLCPLATLAMGPRGRPPAPRGSTDALRAAAVAGLWLIVPARRVLFDRHGPATAVLLVGVASAAWLVGRRLGGRAWCMTACPVHPVERLYGFAPLRSFPNARCARCTGCTHGCADLARAERPPAARWFEQLMLGGFPGFVWGWFHIDARLADEAAWLAWGWPLVGAMASGLVFLAARRARLERLFASAAVATYYWFRLPELLAPASLTALLALRVVGLVPAAWVLVAPAGRPWLRPRSAPEGR